MVRLAPTDRVLISGPLCLEYVPSLLPEDRNSPSLLVDKVPQGGHSI
jgi:hypothetical protein